MTPYAIGFWIALVHSATFILIGYLLGMSVDRRNADRWQGFLTWLRWRRELRTAARTRETLRRIYVEKCRHHPQGEAATSALVRWNMATTHYNRVWRDRFGDRPPPGYDEGALEHLVNGESADGPDSRAGS